MSAQAFPKRARLCDDDQIARVFKRGKRIRGAEFTLLFGDNDRLFPRLCIIVAKKNLRHAHERNTFKRVIREFFRTHQKELGSLDVVVLANKQTELFTKKTLHCAMEQQWKKLISSLNE